MYRLGQRSPIYTLKLFRTKIYVVDSEALLPAVHRSYKTVSFTPAVKVMAETLSGFQPHESRVFDRDEARLGREERLASATLKSFHRAFALGTGAEELQTSMLTHLKTLLDELGPSHTHKVNLFSWVKHTVTQATMRAVDGPGNPLADQAVEDVFW